MASRVVIRYREEKLHVKKRGGRKRGLGTRKPMLVPEQANERWCLDFVSDAFTDGRRFRVLAIVDDFSRECLSLVADTSLSGLRVTRELTAIMGDYYKHNRTHSSLGGLTPREYCQRSVEDQNLNRDNL